MWETKNNQLTKTFTLKNFSAIIKKLRQLAIIADGMNHHPDFTVHGYKNITFNLSTHSENAVTGKDHELAEEIDRLFAK